MQLFRRKTTTEQTVPPELQPYYDTSGPMSASRRWWYVWRILAVVIIVGLIAFGAWLLTDHNKTNKPKTAPVPSAQQSPQNNVTTTPSSPPAQTPASGSTNSGAVQQPSSSLPNTGG